MKRILAAVLAIILCLGLCACSDVKQEVYDTLKSGYDEVSAKYDGLKSKVDKYSTVIEALEKEDYDGAIEAVNAMRPVPEVTEVEITMDNLWDYFEIKENRQEDTDAQGDLIRLFVTRVLSLKEDYSLANRDEYPTDIAVGYEYDRDVKTYGTHCVLDFDSWTCNAAVAWKDQSHCSEMAHFPKSAWMDSSQMNYDNNGNASNNNGAIIVTVENFKVVNASGTLYLVNK